MIPLGLVSSGEICEVVTVKKQNGNCTHSSEKQGIIHRLEELGLRPGKEVQMISNEKRGAVVIKLDNSRIALGRGMAMKIFVRRIAQ